MDKLYIGIRAEDKSYMERRTPIPPHDCKYIMEKHNRIQIVVQPSTKRIFTDEQYLEVGCMVQEDLSICTTIICIKEIPLEKYIEGMTYLNWSHTLEGEPYNMPALDLMLKKNIRHLEYERIYDDNGVNITSFPYAGIAGMITFLNEYGKYLLKRDMNTPFLQIGPTYQYYDKKDAYEALQKAGQAIKERGLPPKLGLPLIIGVMGSTGSCGKGSLEALSQLQITLVDPENLKELVRNPNDKKHRNTVYVCPFKTTDLVRHKHDVHKEFTSQDYYENPLDYEPIFHQKYLPYLTILVNDIYWEYKFPRYVTDSQIKELVESGNSRLQAVCDVTCDLEGSIQFLKKFTNPDHPVFYYNPISQQIHDEFNFNSQNDIMYMSIDFLPSQMPYEASMDFGKALKDIVPYLAYSDPTKPLEESGLPEFLQNATVTLHGQLTKKFEYINDLRKLNETENDHQQFKMMTSYYSNKLNATKENNAISNNLLPQQQLSPKSNSQEIQDDRGQLENSPRNLNIPFNQREIQIDEARKINNQQTFDSQIQIQ